MKLKKNRMKRFLIITSAVVLAFGSTGCGGGEGNNPGSAYMPDMYYSRAYETYGYNTSDVMLDSLRRRGVYFNAMPVAGTIARGDMLPYRQLTADSAGMQRAESLTNPLAAGSFDMKEAERLYLINCGICHGSNLDGNGPLFNKGEGAYSAAPRTLIDQQAKTWNDGHYYHVITFGIRQMGSYASQLRPEQRWMVINYIRARQGAAGDTTKAATQLNQQPGGNADSARQTR